MIHQRCSICPGRFRHVLGDGPTPTDWMCIGERPGQEEEKGGRPFIGKSGREFNENYLYLGGLNRRDVFVTNAVHCLSAKSYVLLANGKAERIDKIVKYRLDLPILGIDEKGDLSIGRIEDWHRSKLGDRKIYRVRYATYKARGGGIGSIRVTEDHQLMTDRGWIRAGDAFGHDDLRICTGTPGFSERQLSAVIAMIMGDGYIGDSRSLTVTHCSDQTEYAALKARLISNVGLINFSKNGFCTRRRPVFEMLASKVSKRRCDIQFVLENFSDVTLAIWFLDDGCSHKSRTGTPQRAEIAATSKLPEDLNRIAELLRDRLGGTVENRRGRLRFDQVASRELFERVAPWTPPCLQYKLPKDLHNQFDESNYKPDYQPFWDKVIIEESDIKEGTTYCLTTNFGNFATVGGVVHNCFAPQNKKPTDREIQTCAAQHLPDELDAVRPSIVFLMGATACSLVPQINLEVEHGIPQWGELYGWEGWLVPIHHPAAGLHQTSMMIAMLNDWEKVGDWLRTGRWQWATPNESEAEPDYRICRTENEVERYFEDYLGNGLGLVGIDTESHGPERHSIQVSIQPGTGIMVLVRDGKGLLCTLGRHIEPYQWVFHNADADLWIEEVFGIRDHPYRDTMREAYIMAGLTPQGLKALSYRRFGVRMQSWEDLVTPHSKRELVQWLVSGIVSEQDRPTIEYRKLKTKVKEIRKPNPVHKELNHVLKHIDSATYDPWARLRMAEALRDGAMTRLMEEIGPLPIMGIQHAPLDEQKIYAVCDADMTLRHALAFDRIKEELVAEGAEWYVPENDWDI